MGNAWTQFWKFVAHLFSSASNVAEAADVASEVLVNRAKIYNNRELAKLSEEIKSLNMPSE